MMSEGCHISSQVWWNDFYICIRHNSWLVLFACPFGNQLLIIYSKVSKIRKKKEQKTMEYCVHIYFQDADLHCKSLISRANTKDSYFLIACKEPV